MSDIYGTRPQNGNGMNERPEPLSDQARTLGKDLKSKAADTTSSVMKTAKEQAATLTGAAKDVAAAATDRVKGVVNDQKGMGADYLGNLAMAAQRAAGEFDSDIPQAATYIRQAASQIETVADAIRQRDVGELMSEVQQFARRQPTLFFGGAMVLGFAALRFLKSSAAQPRVGNGMSASDSPEFGTTPGNSRFGSSEFANGPDRSQFGA